jgi:hypothetical protein
MLVLSLYYNCHILVLMLKLRIVSLFKDVLISNFNKIVEGLIPFLGVQKLENVFRIARKDLRTWFNVLVLNSKEVIFQQHKSRCRKPRDDCSVDLCGCEVLFFALGDTVDLWCEIQAFAAM